MRPIEVLPRLLALRQRLRQERLDALLLVGEANVAYLSGYTNREAFLFITAANAGAANILITDSRYAEQAEAECPDFKIQLYRNNIAGFTQGISGLCGAYGVRSLGFERPQISFERYDALRAELPGIALRPVADMVEDLRQVKDAAEEERLRAACAGTDRVFAELCAFIRPGISERELEWELLCSMRRHGFDAGFPSIVVSGARGSLPHGLANDKQLAQGEFITMDFGCLYQGYHADITRTVFLGRPTQQQRRLYDIVLEAHNRAARLAASGVLCAAVDAAARDYITELGYGENFGHGLGHGVGLDIHERPFMNKSSAERLSAGCFITVEPGIYLPGDCGIRIEDTYLVRENGCETLFSSTKELICL